MHRIELPNDVAVTTEELAREWNCTPRTIRRYRNQGDGLPFLSIAGRIYHPLKECRQWLAKRVQKPNPRRAA